MEAEAIFKELIKNLLEQDLETKIRLKSEDMLDKKLAVTDELEEVYWICLLAVQDAKECQIPTSVNPVYVKAFDEAICQIDKLNEVPV